MPMIAASLHGPDAIFRGRRHSQLTEQTFQSLAEVSGVAETETYEAAVERIELAVAATVEKGKITWLKDHGFCVVPRAVQDVWITGKTLPQAFQRNPTVFSTEFLDNVTPVFLIRHPALSIPSFYRKNITVCKNQADDEDFAVYVALYWSRLIFDSFVLRSGSEAKIPIFVDAADPAEETIDLDERQREWREEFGSEDARTLRFLVDRELEHYEYLKKFKLQA